jgi:hypothetical protein
MRREKESKILVPCSRARSRKEKSQETDQKRGWKRKEKMKRRHVQICRIQGCIQYTSLDHNHHSNNNLTPPPTRPNSLHSALRRPRDLTHTIRRSNRLLKPRLRRMPRPLRMRMLRMFRMFRVMRMMRMSRSSRPTPPNLANRVIGSNIRIHIDINHTLGEKHMARGKMRFRRLARRRAVEGVGGGTGGEGNVACGCG